MRLTNGLQQIHDEGSFFIIRRKEDTTSQK